MTKINIALKNFNKEELTCKCGCGRFNFDEEFLIRLQAYRYILAHPMIITSPGRCVKHNKAVGGVDTSCHQCETKPATAVDFWCTSMANAYDKACKSGLFNEVIWYKAKNFIHLGLDRNQTGNYFKIN